MAKNPSNGNVKVAWILDSALTTKPFTLAATLNAAPTFELSAAIAWQDYQVGADESADIDDRSLVDLGNAVSRGAAQYGATLSMFRDQDNLDVTSIYQQAFEAFRVERTVGWLFVRVNKLASLPWADGDEVSIYKLLADTLADDTEGDDSTKFTVTFLPQGSLFVHSMLGGAGTITGVAATASKTIASGPYQLQPVLNGASIVSRATYSTSDPSKVTVSVGGTVTPIGVGSATITVSYGAATASVSHAVTVTA